MTGIKPPGSDSAPFPADKLEGVESDELSPTDSIERLAESSELEQAQPASGTDPIAQLAADLRAGDIDVDTATDRLIERAMGDVAAVLSSAERQDLEAMLREALEADPTLSGLRGDLESV